MDTVYGTKKYFQSLSGASDIYRAPNCRTVTNDYTTYQNTISRRSQLGYYHMNKQPSYATTATNEHSMNSQYGYNTWGMWRDGRNMAPSTFSAKTHTHYQKTRSFSIILTTAAFIVLLAVISIAGLAFYFSSIKANMEDPVLGFEGSFRIAKGDLYSTGLKYNHTTTYKQKIEFYKRFVERSLMDNGLQTLRTDIWGFGEGPLIKVNFRIFLDVRKLPQNIHSVEDYIKESLFLETTAMKSLYRSLRIDAESVEIKRILDEEVVKSASLFRDVPTAPTSQTQLEKRLMKKGGGTAGGGGNTPALAAKPAATTTAKPRTTARPHAPDEEPDVDVENAPVIQGSFEGSFEITKTDADIARKKVPPTKAYTSLPPKAVTPYALRVKPKKPSIEKLTTIIPQQLPAQTPTTTSTTSTSTTTTTTTTTTMKPTTTKRSTTTTTTTTTTTPTPPPTTTTTTTTSTTARPPPPALPTQFTFLQLTTPPSTHSVPQLDTNLFTSLPVLDTQPWRPMHREVSELLPGPPPAYPTKTLPTINMASGGEVDATGSETGTGSDSLQELPHRRIDDEELPFIEDEAVPPAPAIASSPYDPYSPNFFGTSLRKPAGQPQDIMFYHSFGNPVFMPGADGIERLGIGAHVQPHPLPVPLIDDVVIPPFRPLHATLGTNEKLPFNIEAGEDEKFEHLGGGVIVKKHDSVRDRNKDKEVEESTVIIPTSTSTTTMATTNMNPTQRSEENVDATDRNEMSTDAPQSIEKVTANSELADSIGEFFMGLLNLTKDDLKPSSTPQPPAQSRVEPEMEATSQTLVEKESVAPVTTKPNFMNLKEIILKRNQVANQTKKFSSFSGGATATTTSTPRIITTTTTTRRSPTTTENPTLSPPTTKRTRIRPTYQKPPTIMDDSQLFPSHSKWEFVNSSSSSAFGHTGNMRKVFNQTLQAWVSEDVERAENLTLNDIKTRINNATNIQDISLIFDTLASKLGITPSGSTKVPPFSQNKMKQTQQSTPTTTTTRAPPTTTTLPVLEPEAKSSPSSMEAAPPAATLDDYIELPLQRHEPPFIRPMASFITEREPAVEMSGSAEGVGAAVPVVGEAEVEVIDPNRYEEMLKSSQFAEATTTQTPLKLVTLLPVRSNSGIRTYRPIEEQPESLEEQQQRSNSDSAVEAAPPTTSATAKAKAANTEPRSIIKRKSDLKPVRRLSPPPEAIVKGGLRVTVK